MSGQLGDRGSCLDNLETGGHVWTTWRQGVVSGQLGDRGSCLDYLETGGHVWTTWRQGVMSGLLGDRGSCLDYLETGGHVWTTWRQGVMSGQLGDRGSCLDNLETGGHVWTTWRQGVMSGQLGDRGSCLDNLETGGHVWTTWRQGVMSGQLGDRGSCLDNLETGGHVWTTWRQGVMSGQLGDRGSCLDNLETGGHVWTTWRQGVMSGQLGDRGSCLDNLETGGHVWTTWRQGVMSGQLGDRGSCLDNLETGDSGNYMKGIYISYKSLIGCLFLELKMREEEPGQDRECTTEVVWTGERESQDRIESARLRWCGQLSCVATSSRMARPPPDTAQGLKLLASCSNSVAEYVEHLNNWRLSRLHPLLKRFKNSLLYSQKVDGLVTSRWDKSLADSFVTCQSVGSARSISPRDERRSITEIAKRLNAIIAQVLPFLGQEHQQQVATAVERAKQVTMTELNAIIGVSCTSIRLSVSESRDKGRPSRPCCQSVDGGGGGGVYHSTN
uniref:Groucho/TLE N-terminal Q-rich domain-containing protein n=1 Tax=Timema monikensis TaxID=170555 RepID=A0A7R9ECY6_9NEOP|nr:unnamed protein product [Timema monikensis]